MRNIIAFIRFLSQKQ